MKVLITGSRTWTKKGPIEALMRGMPEATFILGDNPAGVDAIALEVARDYKLKHVVKLAHWSLHEGCYCRDKTQSCKFAGHRRNGDMVAAGPQVGFAFRNEGASPGTDNCILQCYFAGVPIYRILPTSANTEGVGKITTKKQPYNSMLEG